MASRLHELRTARLLLRRWRASDREDFAALNADPEVMRYFPSTMDREASDALVDRIEQHFDTEGWGFWALEVRSTGQFIGFTGLNSVPDDLPVDGDVEVGWRLAAQAWHQGYATEAAHAAVLAGFTQLGLSEIVSFTALANAPSRAVMRRIGMSEEREFDHPRIPPGHELRRHVLYRRRPDPAVP